ncbi:MAG: hypothetical protein DDT31_00462 [Syntrophomonadaceae bacterium]|nr:hypothetical protein [Bacillota bacterium]
MKKILVVSVMVLGLVTLSPSAHAIIPGLEDMGIEVRAGLEHASRDWERPGFKGESTTLGLFAEPTFEVMEGLDAYLKLGMASIEFKSAGVTFDGDMDLGWGLGVKYTMPLDGLGLPGMGIIEGMPFGEALEVGAGFEYIAPLSSDYRAVRRFPAGSLKIRGWRLSLFASEDMGMFVPYIGLRYSDMELKQAAVSFDAADNFGIFLGADIPMDFANINVEIGFLDETSFKVGASFAF